MSKFRKRFLIPVLSALLTASTLGGLFPANAKAEGEAAVGKTASLRILETTDLHSNIMPYDYYQGVGNQKFGLAKTATLIQQARKEATNSMLFDAGDSIQGNPLATYAAKNLKGNEVHPLFKAMNTLDYDAAIVGNHEFNYGLDYLDRVLKGAEFDVINANVYRADNGKNYFTPYKIIDKTIKDDAGQESVLKVGVIGFVPPQILNWDKFYLDGKVTVAGITETARKFIPEMRKEGADIIVAIAHSGCDIKEEDSAEAENAVFQLTKVPGIDVMLFGHAHKVFPSSSFKDMEGIDHVNGYINGVPALEAGKWGDNLGVLDLKLVQDENGKWTADKPASKSTVRPVAVDTALDQTIVDGVKDYHEATIRYVNEKIGETTKPMYSFFSRVTDDASLQLVNQVQIDYATKWLTANKPELKDIPVISAMAPFKNNTNVAVGDLSIKSATDLYNFDNTIKAVKMTGAQVREWLEFSASSFNTIDPAKEDSQELLDTKFPGYLFDVIDGVKYQVDVTQPRRYDWSKGALENASANRIINFTNMDGTPIKDDQLFIVVTNNYRAGGGGKFPGLVDGKAELVLDSTDEIRDILMDYIRAKGVISPAADQNWSIAPLNEKVTVTFTAPNGGKQYLNEVNNIKALNQEADGYETYQLVFASADQPQNPGTPGDQTPSEDSGTPTKDAGTVSGSNGSQNTGSVPAQSNKLPNTSTNMFNLLLFGLLLVAAGGGMLFLKRRRA
ncbi:bifunctional 2',3'-cyclic-nucleotide 2'-phosphodiesterase/3'-nucleotidase [Neobacillus niacini]|uniref:bifunctional 2',3'-cyclic-nucleotide 2'-phosphodiesterase/3'-nucleotidase n=1 Tax=Neobacillus niacini TaxID=86668 RepID=UPI0021CB3120|nr:bifunctional 2',3'-cyclic-nucleotide 2'-phosphodiesterase/3'-nucleotidase [Neobacillus niacini]MCM3763571.1 bifunctional 2',3'-cyclic-nucleotide 2'-phosphodiesterase/3'-nucleotidase [Neobacillus niacini]